MTSTINQGGRGSKLSMEHTEQGDPPVYGLAEVARALGMTRTSATNLRGRDNMIRNGTAPAIDGRVLFPIADWIVSGNPVWKPSTIRAYGRATGRIAPVTQREPQKV